MNRIREKLLVESNLVTGISETPAIAATIRIATRRVPFSDLPTQERGHTPINIGDRRGRNEQAPDFLKLNDIGDKLLMASRRLKTRREAEKPRGAPKRRGYHV